MRKIDTQSIADTVYRLALRACRSLTPSCLAALERAEKTETSPAARFALQTCLKNAEVAVEECMPVCQDTGMAVVFLSVGVVEHDGFGICADAEMGGLFETHGFLGTGVQRFEPV